MKTILKVMLIDVMCLETFKTAGQCQRLRLNLHYELEIKDMRRFNEQVALSFS